MFLSLSALLSAAVSLRVTLEMMDRNMSVLMSKWSTRLNKNMVLFATGLFFSNEMINNYCDSLAHFSFILSRIRERIISLQNVIWDLRIML